MTRTSSHQAGISSEELKEAIPEFLADKHIHLHWIEKTPAGKGLVQLTAKIEIDGQAILLHAKTDSIQLIEDWDRDDPTYHTNARLVALERILTDPGNEVILLSL
jgi:hypothetical protein